MRWATQIPHQRVMPTCRLTLNNTAAIIAGFRNAQLTWTGAANSDWHNAAKLDLTINEGVSGATSAVHRVPRSIDNILIPSGVVPAPTISSGNATAREVVIASGATLR